MHNADYWLREASVAFKAGTWKSYYAAVEAASNCISLDPYCAEAYAIRARACLHGGFWTRERIKADALRCIELNPNIAAVYTCVAASIYSGIEYKDGCHEDVLHYSEMALGIDELDAEAWRFKGLAKKGLNDLAGALACFDKAIGIKANDWTLFFVRATIKYEMRDLKGAREDASIASSFDSRANLAVAHEFGGKPDFPKKDESKEKVQQQDDTYRVYIPESYTESTRHINDEEQIMRALRNGDGDLFGY